MAKKKRPSDIWNEIGKDFGEMTENKREKFVREVAQQREGISADREKFIMDLHTGSPKVLPPNKRD